MLKALFFTWERSRLHQVLLPHPLHISSPRHPLLPGKGQAKDLKQALLGRQPKYFSAFDIRKKKRKITTERTTVRLSSQPTLFLMVLLVFHSLWSFYLSFSLRTMKISSIGGWSCSFLGGIMDFGAKVEWHHLYLHHIYRMSCSFTRLSLHFSFNSACSLKHIG